MESKQRLGRAVAVAPKRRYGAPRRRKLAATSPPAPFGLRRGSLLSPTRAKAGGARRDRTDDLKLAKLPLSQLSYGPNRVSVIRSQGSGKEPVLIPDFRLPIPDPGGPGKTRTSDLTLIKRAL